MDQRSLIRERITEIRRCEESHIDHNNNVLVECKCWPNFNDASASLRMDFNAEACVNFTLILILSLDGEEWWGKLH